MIKNTESTKAAQITRKWHLIDVKGKILGRASTEIALLLMGKSKPYFVRNLDCGDNVIVINAKEIVVSGTKNTDKIYYRHSGYPGGLRAEAFDKLQKRRPDEVIRHAVKGMLPQNKLRDKMLKHLFIFPGEEHTYAKELK